MLTPVARRIGASKVSVGVVWGGARRWGIVGHNVYVCITRDEMIIGGIFVD